MKLFWCPRTRSARVVWMLEEIGVPYERVHIDIKDEASRTPEFLVASPLGKVPALADGDVRVADSAAICLYLADRYSSGSLAPALDHPDRGTFLFWMFYSPGVIEPAMAERIGGWTPNPYSHGWGDFDSMIKVWASTLENRTWLLGETFSAADVMVGSSAVFLKMFDLLPESEVLHAYAQRCLDRPAYQKSMSLENEA